MGLAVFAFQSYSRDGNGEDAAPASQEESQGGRVRVIRGLEKHETQGTRHLKTL